LASFVVNHSTWRLRQDAIRDAYKGGLSRLRTYQIASRLFRREYRRSEMAISMIDTHTDTQTETESDKSAYRRELSSVSQNIRRRAARNRWLHSNERLIWLGRQITTAETADQWTVQSHSLLRDTPAGSPLHGSAPSRPAGGANPSLRLGTHLRTPKSRRHRDVFGSAVSKSRYPGGPIVQCCTPTLTITPSHS